MFEYLFTQWGPYALAPLFLCMWVFVCVILSVWGGWRALARAYPDDRELAGEVFRFQSAQLRGGTSYSGCLTLGVDYQGLRLSVFFLFRPGHSPISIPWSDISVEPKRRWWFRRAVFTFARCPDIPLVVSMRLAERVLRTAGRSGEFPA